MRSARGTKEWACRKGPRDINAYVTGFRGDEMVAMVILQNHDRDQILAIASGVANGMDCDVISLTFEAWVAVGSGTDEKRLLNPMTGQPWRDGEMAEVAQKHGGLESGAVRETLNVMVANRAADIGMGCVPFRYSGKHLIFEEEDKYFLSTTDGNQTKGRMPDVLARIMLHPSGNQIIHDTDSFGRDERDIRTAQMISKMFPCGVMLASDFDDDTRLRKMRKVATVMDPEAMADGDPD
jgi:hypothetical protein